MDDVRPVPPRALCNRFDPARVPFETTAEAQAGDGVVGQERAARALEFGLGVAGHDYNVFVMGPEGVGRHTLVKDALAVRAARGAPPSEWVYVNNFAAPRQPLALELPAGRGVALRDDIDRLVAELRTAIPAIFDSEEYAQRVEKIDSQLVTTREKALSEIGEDAQAQGVTLLRTPVGYAFAAWKEGQVVNAEDFDKLPEEERNRITAAIEALQERLEKVVRDIMRARKERAGLVANLDREMVALAASPLFDELARCYAEFPKVVGWLEAVREDALDSADLFRRHQEAAPAVALMGAEPFERGLRKYAVKVLVERPVPAKPEVVACDHPTYANLVGRIEHIHHLGTLVTDFTLLEPGALHRANGGYLVVDALRILTQPFAWEALKRALTRREVRVEPASELWGLVSSASLEPEPIPLAVKVVMIGERRLYYLLQALDPDFDRLFKVVADFEDSFERDDASCDHFARLIAGLAARDALLPLDRGAVARAIDDAARRASDQRRLSADLAAMGQLLREADFLAREAGHATICAADVTHAVDARRERSERLKRRIQEAIGRGTILIDTTGSTVGQVNGLALVPLGEFPFAEPARITATARPGEGQVVDIQREAQLGGAIHSKGVMILAQFLAARYSPNRPLSLAASLVFEQTYGPVEGDSASLAELCALLSALANAPVRQSLAVTGSVNQRGEVQAVGGVNEKVEGFFEVCRERGLDGSQGVIIPSANVEHLMLRDDVVEAVAAGRFHVHPVRTVDEALALLTGLPAGAADAAALESRETANGRVARRLRDFARERHPVGRVEISTRRRPPRTA